MREEILSEQYIDNLLSVIAEAKERFKINKEIQDLAQKEQEDLLHEIEICRFDIQRGYRLAKELQLVRQRRRQAKEENLTLCYLCDFLDKNPQFKNGLISARNSIKQKKSYVLCAKYQPRVRTDLPTINGEAKEA